MKRMKIVVCCLFILSAAGLLAFSPGGHAQNGAGNAANTPLSICSVWPLPPPSKIGEEKYRSLLKRFIANPSNNDQENYQTLLNLYVTSECYRQSGSPGRWQSDTQIRDTGVFIVNKSLGTHNAVRVYYSGEVVEWLKKREVLRTGAPVPVLPDGAMIIKEMYPAPAQQQITDPKHKCADYSSRPVGYGCTGLAIMVRDNGGVYDGWFWSDGSKSIDYTQYPNAGYGLYCVNCHASAKSGLTFSSLNNINGNPIIFNSTMEPNFIYPGMREDRGQEPSARRVGLSQTKEDVSVHLKRDNKPDYPGDVLGTEPATAHPTPNATPTPIPRQLVNEWYDWATQPRASASPQMFLTSSQCIGCHDATQNNAAMPNMIYPQVFVTPTKSTSSTAPVTHEVDLNLSPYSEWRSSMMGLSGRDPVFFSQLETEMNLYPGIKEQTVDTCLSCHGVMGERQIKLDTNGKEKIKLGYLDLTTQQPYAKYGALARDGVSCAVCHHISDEGLGVLDPNSPRDVVRFTTDTGRFKTGPANEIYGPYRQVATVPMKNSLGVTPLLKEQSKSAQIDVPAIKSSALCGTCHTVVLPVLDPAKKYTERDDVFNKAFNDKVETEHEQNTYIEWLNSDYQNEAKIARRPVNEQVAQSCQDCHMPTKYPSKTGKDLQFKVASIEDDTFPAAENSNSNEDLHLRTRGAPGSEDKYSRHTLLGLNLFVMEMFNQFPDKLGISNVQNSSGKVTTSFYDPMATWGNPVPSMVLSKKAGLDLARNETAKVEITSLERTNQDTLKANVKVTNLAGHKFPSGVSFRRAFIEFRVNVDGKTVWASGATNDCSDPKQRVEPVPCGVIGVFDTAGNFKPLTTEFFDSQPSDRPQVYQPHYEKITQQDQVQIYEELVKDAGDRFTTSFLSLKTPVKDNRLMPLGWRPDNLFAADTRPRGEAERDPLYLNGSGTDVVSYEVPINARPGQQVTATATIYYQTIPPYYLQQRYRHSDGVFTQSLKWYVNNLKTDINFNIVNNPGSNWGLLLDEAPIKNWKLMINTTSRRL